MINFSSFNRLISMLNWALWFVPTKEATPIKTAADTVLRLEPYVNVLLPKVNQLSADLQPAVKIFMANLPTMIKLYKDLEPIIVANIPTMVKLYNDLQPAIPEIQAAIKVLVAAWPEIMKAYDTAEPIIKLSTKLVEANKKKGMSHEDAVAHVTKFMQSRLGPIWE